MLRALLCLALALPLDPAAARGEKEGGAADAPLGERVDAAIQRGATFLLETQEQDGSWEYGHHSPGATALALYALLHANLAGEEADAAADAAIAYLATARAAGTYSTALVIMALAKAGAEEHQVWIDELAGQLVETQAPGGGWGYPGGEDLSNTQYAALGLRAAVLAGVHVPDEVWSGLAGMVRACGGRGGYGYTRGSGAGARGSMTAAGVGTLAICQAMLARAGALEGSAAADFERDAKRGVEWLGRTFDVESNPGGGKGWHYYYLYGLERVGSLLGVQDLGEHDWYARGAQYLVQAQGSDGSWSPGGHSAQSQLLDSAFALLFLRRATRVETGIGSKQAQRAWSTEAEGAGLFVSATGGQQMTLWLAGVERSLAQELEWPGQGGRGPHVDQARWFIDGRLAAILPGDDSVPLDLQRFPLRHTFEREGSHVVRLALEVLPPPRTDRSGTLWPGLTRRVESPDLVVEVRDVIPAWRSAQLGDRARNLVPAAQPKVHASSVLGASRRDLDAAYGAARAVDGRLRSSWLAAPGDERPTLTVSFPRAVRADVILVSSAVSVPHRPGWFGRPLEVLVSIDNGPDEVLRMHADERRKGRLELDEPRTIRRLELTIPLWAPGTGKPGSPGLAEVELQLSDR